MASQQRKKVFISHSHLQRDLAAELNSLLRDNGAETYLDQEQIQPGDSLPSRIETCVARCDTFLLIWSAMAAQSQYVNDEWNLAYEQRKRIIPFMYDSAPLPNELSNLVYIKSDDRERGFGDLLLTVFGKGFEPPDPVALIPGRWELRPSVNMPELGSVVYYVELRRNGQISGTAQMGDGGIMEELAKSFGLGHMLQMKGRITGSWRYDHTSNLLIVDMTAHAGGFPSNREVIKIWTCGDERGTIEGRDDMNRVWRIQHVRK